MKILTLNCGGSSMKYQFLDMPREKLLAKGSIDRLGTAQSIFKHKGNGDFEIRRFIPDFAAGISLAIEHLMEDGLIAEPRDISLVAHKLAHGGEKFRGAVLITDELLKTMGELSQLAPVHNPPSIRGIEQCKEILGGIPQTGVFETSFHRTVPDYAYTYGLPLEWRERYGIRKYGFHGASHRYVTERLAELTGRGDLKIVSCHLGSGTSVAAIDSGASVDISSGFTPQSGTIMSTRPGDFDPWVFPYAMDVLGVSADEANQIMVKQGGLLGISGVSGDMRDLESAEAAGDDRARLAIDVFCYQIKKYIGAFTAAMNGIDALIFTGGIGEKSPSIRKRICSNLSYLGIELDEAKNQNREDEFDISGTGSRVRIQTIATNEEIMVARESYRFLARE